MTNCGATDNYCERDEWGGRGEGEVEAIIVTKNSCALVLDTTIRFTT